MIKCTKRSWSLTFSWGNFRPVRRRIALISIPLILVSVFVLLLHPSPGFPCRTVGARRFWRRCASDTRWAPMGSRGRRGWSGRSRARCELSLVAHLSSPVCFAVCCACLLTLLPFHSYPLPFNCTLTPRSRRALELLAEADAAVSSRRDKEEGKRWASS